MSLPAGVRSLTEISQLSLIEDRVRAYATLLECILRTLAPEIGPKPEFSELFRLHSGKFTRPKRVLFAYAVRSDLVHGNGKFSPDKWGDAAEIFENTIIDVCRRISDDMRTVFLGENLVLSPEENACTDPFHPLRDERMQQFLDEIHDRSKREVAAEPYDPEMDPEILCGIGKEEFTDEQLEIYYRLGFGACECPRCEKVVDFDPETTTDSQRVKCEHCGAQLIYREGALGREW